MIKKLAGAVVVGALIGAIMPMGCGKSEPSPLPIQQRAHYGEFGYLRGLDDDPIDRLLEGNDKILRAIENDRVHRLIWGH